MRWSLEDLGFLGKILKDSGLPAYASHSQGQKPCADWRRIGAAIKNLQT